MWRHVQPIPGEPVTDTRSNEVLGPVLGIFTGAHAGGCMKFDNRGSEDSLIWAFADKPNSLFSWPAKSNPWLRLTYNCLVVPDGQGTFEGNFRIDAYRESDSANLANYAIKEESKEEAWLFCLRCLLQMPGRDAMVEAGLMNLRPSKGVDRFIYTYTHQTPGDGTVPDTVPTLSAFKDYFP